MTSPLQAVICVSGDAIFRKGEIGDLMYFVKRGQAQVFNAEGVIVHTFSTGDSFGEIALLSDVPRTADVYAHTDCMLLSLHKGDFMTVLSKFPSARAIIEKAAQV